MYKGVSCQYRCVCGCVCVCQDLYACTLSQCVCVCVCVYVCEGVVVCARWCVGYMGNSVAVLVCVCVCVCVVCVRGVRVYCGAPSSDLRPRPDGALSPSSDTDTGTLVPLFTQAFPCERSSPSPPPPLDVGF